MKSLLLLPLLLALAACKQEGQTPVWRKADSTERFYSGCARPGEFLSTDDLPPIPPTFDEDVQ